MMRKIFFFMIFASLANLTAWADSEADSYSRIARISYLEGPVSFQSTADTDWTAASINIPLQPGDRIYTGDKGRAEIQFDDGSVCRMAEKTDLQILTLDDNFVQLRVLYGLSFLTVSSGSGFEMDTPAAAFSVLDRGTYRFNVKENGDTDAVVRKGELEGANDTAVRRVEPGEYMRVTAGDDGTSYVALYRRWDSWDSWNDSRDAESVVPSRGRNLPDNVYMGVNDLNRYGRWVTVETYGSAWVPFSVGVSWSPYTVGRWCYRPVWGWTWVSYEPWGWLPYHYGRWYHSVRIGWCWLPGPSFSFNFWSPGLVTFYYGPSWVSWCPLGPGDYYSINNYYYNHRLYRHQLVQLRGLHRRAPGDPFNRHVHGAFRTAEINRFRDGSFSDRGIDARWHHVDKPWAEGSLVRERLAVHPDSGSYNAAPRRAAPRPRTDASRQYVVRTEPKAGNARKDYVRITNPGSPERTIRRTEAPDTRRTDRMTDTGRDRSLQNRPATETGNRRDRSGVDEDSGNAPARRAAPPDNRRSGDRNSQSYRESQDGARNGNGAVRSIPRDDSRQRSERSFPASIAAPPIPDASSRDAGVSQRSWRGNSGPAPSERRILSTPGGVLPRDNGNVRSNRPSRPPEASGNSRSGSGARVYSAPSAGRSETGRSSASGSSSRGEPSGNNSSGGRSARRR